MLRAKYAFLVLLLFAFAGCVKKNQENAAQQAPAASQPSAAQPTPQQVPPDQAAAPEPSGSTPSSKEPAPAARATKVTKSAPKATAAVNAPPPKAEAAAPGSGVAPAAESKALETSAAPKIPEPEFAAIASGTHIPVRLQIPLDSSVNKTGDTFTAVLDKDIEVDGKVVAARGCAVEGKLSHVERSGRVQGRAGMSLQLTSLTVGDQAYPLQTEIVALEAESTTKKDAAKVGIGAGLGAIIGAIAGGGKGAAIGAAVGGGAGGATVVATRGKELKFDTEQRFNFVLRTSVNIKIQ